VYVTQVWWKAQYVCGEREREEREAERRETERERDDKMS